MITPETLNALVNMGSAGAVIVVVVIFLRSIRERDAEWRSFFTALSSNSQTDIDQMRVTAERIIKSLDLLLSMYSQHDTRAATIQAAIDGIKQDMVKLTSTSTRAAPARKARASE